jgi:hypothetical protein
VLSRHTCAHRVDTLLDLVDELLLRPSSWLAGDEEDELERSGAASGVRRCDPAHHRSPLA